MNEFSECTVLLFTGEKGGIGKTTLSTSFAALSAAMGLRVLIVDADPQGHTTLLMGYEKHPGLYDMLVRNVAIEDRIMKVSPEVYCPPGVESRGSLSLLGGNNETQAIPNLVRDSDALAYELDDIKSFFDLIVIDTQPSPSALLAFMYEACDYVVIPTKLEYLSIDGLMSTIDAISKDKFKLSLLGVVPNMYHWNYSLHEYNLEALRKHAVQSGWHMFSPIRQAVAWAEASQERKMVYTLDRETGNARTDSQRLTREILDKLGIRVK